MTQWILAAFLVASSVVVRFIPHLWNFTPVLGAALFCGAVFPRPWAFAVPVAAMLAGDLLLGVEPINLYGWIAVALSAGLGDLLRNRRRAGTVAAASVAASTLFFLISNFGVWMLGHDAAWYPPTFQGLTACYAAGIPFYRNALAGDLLYTAILFGSYGLFMRRVVAESL